MDEQEASGLAQTQEKGLQRMKIRTARTQGGGMREILSREGKIMEKIKER